MDASDTLPMDSAVVHELRSIIEECQGLQRYSEQGLARVGQRVEIRSITGEAFHVSVNPETDVVASLKAKIAEKRGVLACALKLFPSSAEEAQAEAFTAYEAARVALAEAQEAFDKASREWQKAQDMQMANKELLSKFDLSRPVTMVVCSIAIENEMLRLKFDSPEDLGFERVSEKSGAWLSPEQKQPVETLGRRGIDFQGHCVLQLADPIVLGEAWTISVWTLAPLAPKGFRNLLDDTGDNRIVVSITNGRIGDYNLGAYVNYDPSQLPEGWHHIVAVGCGGSVFYYVDREPVGRHVGQSQGRISTIGNRGDGQCSESWGVMSDLRIFGAAVSAQQVEALFAGGL